MAKQRMTFLDVLRGVAVFWMVETHVTDVCLAPSEKLGDRLWLLNLSNGFVAVTFIFCAGASFWLVASKKEADFRALGPGLRKYLERIFFILLLGYLMHLPTDSFAKLQAAPYEVWKSFLAIDVLPLISYTSLLALVVFWALPKAKWLPYAAAALALAVFGATSAVWEWNVYDHGWPLGLAGMLGRQPEVMFPLFPWSGYFFVGLVLAACTEWLQDRPNVAALTAALSLGAGLWGYHHQDPLEPDWWWTAPNYILFRVGFTVAIYLGLMLLFRALGERRPLAARALEIAGQESLFLYLVHVFLVYGSLWQDTSLRNFVQGGLPLWQNFAVFGLVMAFVYALMLGYRWTKQRWPDYTKWTKYALVGLLVGQFLFK